jgi:hypothetical protein
MPIDLHMSTDLSDVLYCTCCSHRDFFWEDISGTGSSRRHASFANIASVCPVACQWTQELL